MWQVSRQVCKIFSFRIFFQCSWTISGNEPLIIRALIVQDKPVMLPERPKAKNTPSVPEFVRNVMGSSAGAGSGEFHVYRHLRRKEYARQKFIQEKAHKVNVTTIIVL